MTEKLLDGVYLLSSAMPKNIADSVTVPTTVPAPPVSRKRGMLDQLRPDKSKLAKVDRGGHSGQSPSVNSDLTSYAAGQRTTRTTTKGKRQIAPLRGIAAASGAADVQPPNETEPPPRNRFTDLTHSIIISTPVGKSIEEFASFDVTSPVPFIVAHLLTHNPLFRPPILS